MKVGGDMEIPIEFELQEADMTKAVSALPAVRRQRLLGYFGLVAGAVLFIIGLSDNVFRVWLVGAAPIMIGVSALLLVMPRFAGRRVLHNYKSEERRVKMQLSENGYHIHSAKGRSETPWTAVHRVMEDKSSFLFFVTDQIAQVLPKRVLTEDQVSTLRGWLHTAVKERQPKSRLKFTLIIWVVLILLFFLIYTIVQAA